MSNSTNQLNQRISNLYALVGQGGGGSQNLNQVLTTGNDAGNLSITNVNDLDVNTINGSTYPPTTATLSQVLTAGNTATNSIVLNNAGVGSNVISLLPNFAAGTARITLTDGTTANNITNVGYTTTASSSTDPHYLHFSNSSATGIGAIQRTAGISCVPSTNTITATTFAGTATNATNVGIAAVTDAGPYYPAFVSATTGNLPVKVNVSFTYNPSTGILTIPKLVLSNLPTSAAGLPSGSVWNNAGVLNIV